jgi:hypothetical protein
LSLQCGQAGACFSSRGPISAGSTYLYDVRDRTVRWRSAKVHAAVCEDNQKVQVDSRRQLPEGLHARYAKFTPWPLCEGRKPYGGRSAKLRRKLVNNPWTYVSRRRQTSFTRVQVHGGVSCFAMGACQSSMASKTRAGGSRHMRGVKK